MFLITIGISISIVERTINKYIPAQVTGQQGQTIYKLAKLTYGGRWQELRDKNAGLPIDMPVNYYPDDDDTKRPVNSWRSSANLLYSNWLNYFVYQTTPYDITEINKEEKP